MPLHPCVNTLVIDNDPGFVSALRRLLRWDGYTVDTAANGRHAIALLPEQQYDVLLCDLRMPGLDGPAFYSHLRRYSPLLCQRIIFFTGGLWDLESQGFLAQCGQPWVAKPCRAAAVRSAVVQMLNTPCKDVASRFEEHRVATEGVV